MVLVKDGDSTNYEEVFVDRSGQLKGLDCHLIYTAPISLRILNEAQIFGISMVNA